jgi:hypothetical protein
VFHIGNKVKISYGALTSANYLLRRCPLPII